MWKGEDASYSAIHHFLLKHFPKTGICDECGTAGKTHHALLRGRAYSRNRGDYQELCPRCHKQYDEAGELNPQSKLTAEQVREIRRRYVLQRGGRPKGCGDGPREGSAAFLAAEFGVSKILILNIVNRRKWASVQ